MAAKERRRVESWVITSVLAQVWMTTMSIIKWLVGIVPSDTGYAIYAICLIAIWPLMEYAVVHPRGMQVPPVTGPKAPPSMTSIGYQRIDSVLV